MFKLNDFIKIKPDEKITSLTDEEKIGFVSATKSKKGLYITYYLSHSGRRINNRIYPTLGQQKGINTVLKPYPKPILQNHDKDKDPIGRFVSAEWEDLSDEAIKFFNNVDDYMEVVNAYNGNDPKQIYSVMKKYNLLTNPEWPGLGRMKVKAHITDKEAVEKFLDGRYITFSAGSNTNRHVCSICDSDWAKGDMCEHRHGRIYDGEICVFITGDFNVMEGSVVNMPADDLSQLQSMEIFSDSIDLPEYNPDDFKVDSSGIIISDSFYSLEENNMNKDDKEIEEVSEKPSVSLEEPDLSDDQLAEDKLVEKIINKITEKYSGLFRKLKEDSDEETATKEIEEETETSIETEDIKENETQELENGDGAEVHGLQDNLSNETASEEKVIGDFDGDLSQILKEEKAIKEKKLSSDDVEVDWYLLDCALRFELNSTEVEIKDEDSLSDEIFCGPNRTFPILDCSYVSAARQLVSKANLSDAQKTKILSIVDEKANALKCDSKNVELEEKYKLEIDELKKEIEALKENYLKNIEKEDSIDPSDKIIENPSIGSSDEISCSGEFKDLGVYERNFIQDYKTILERDGEIQATSFYIRKSRYLKKGFDPKKYIN